MWLFISLCLEERWCSKSRSHDTKRKEARQVAEMNKAGEMRLMWAEEPGLLSKEQPQHCLSCLLLQRTEAWFLLDFFMFAREAKSSSCYTKLPVASVVAQHYKPLLGMPASHSGVSDWNPVYSAFSPASCYCV